MGWGTLSVDRVLGQLEVGHPEAEPFNVRDKSLVYREQLHPNLDSDKQIINKDYLLLHHVCFSFHLLVHL